MKVFDIINEALPDGWSVTKDSSGLWQAIDPNGTVRGSSRIRGNAVSAAEDYLSRARPSASTSTPVNDGNIKNLKTFPDGTIEIELKDGTTHKGAPKDVFEKIASGNQKQGLLRKISNAVRRTSRALTKTTFFTFVGLAEIAPIIMRFHEQVVALEEMWAMTYPEGHAYALGSAHAKEMINRTVRPYRNAMYVALGVVAARLLGELIAAGRALRIARGITAAIPPASPWTFFVKALLFVAVEGLVFTTGWLIQKYGPDFFTAMATNTLEEYFDKAPGEIASDIEAAVTPEPEIDRRELFKRIRDERSGEGGSDTDSSDDTDTDTDNRSRNSGSVVNGIDTSRYSFGR